MFVREREREREREKGREIKREREQGKGRHWERAAYCLVVSSPAQDLASKLQLQQALQFAGRRYI